MSNRWLFGKLQVFDFSSCKKSSQFKLAVRADVGEVEGWWSRSSIAALSRSSCKLMLHAGESRGYFEKTGLYGFMVWLSYVVTPMSLKIRSSSIFIPLLRTIIISISLTRRGVITGVIENRMQRRMHPGAGGVHTRSRINGRLNSISDIELMLLQD